MNLERAEVERLARDPATAELCRVYLLWLDAHKIAATNILSPTRAEFTSDSPMWADWAEEGRRFRLLPER